MNVNDVKQAWKKRSKFEQWLIFIAVLVVIGMIVRPFVMEMLGPAPMVEEGVAAQAKVIRVHDTGEGLTAASIVSVDLAVTDKGGMEFPATVKMPLSLIRAQELKAGKPVAVKYDANDRTKVSLVLEEKKP